MEYIGYSDGCCKKNPGPGGWGCVFIETTKNVQYRFMKKGGSFQTTNQIMELTGCLELLKIIPRKEIDVTLIFDSTYVIKGIIKDTAKILSQENIGWLLSWKKNGWEKPGGIKNLHLWKNIYENILELLHSQTKIRISWVKSHTGEEGNELVDRLANEGLKEM